MNDQGLRVVLGWHMHQPEYREPGNGPRTGAFILPWTYLHAIKDYADMAAHLEEVEGARAVVNFAPILLDQLADYAGQIAAHRQHGALLRDPLLAALAAPVLPGDMLQRLKLMEDCLRANERRLIARYPAYAALVERCKILRERPQDIGEGFLSDLLVWYHLAWMGESFKRSTLLVQTLVAQERSFTLSQRLELLGLIGEIVADIVPRYRRLAGSGRVELSVTPYDHPILPLLLEIDSAHEAMPDAPLPAREYPGGDVRARWHLSEGVAAFEEAFGFKPSGCWCSEGAVSAAAIRLLPDYGLHWTATGQGVLANSLGEAAPPFPSAPYRLSADHPAIFFRDDDLSDRIGFRYSGWSAEDAVGDLVAALEDRATRCAPGSVITIFLDGENAWEHYAENGWGFLSQLYARLASHPRLHLTTFKDVLASAPASAGLMPLQKLVTGSWVYGTLSTWIGSADKNRGWDLLIDAKLAFDRFAADPQVAPVALEQASRQLGVCEGSDWFWWLGDYNPAGAVADFESLFRRHLRSLYAMLGEPAPPLLDDVLSRGQGDPAGGGTMRMAAVGEARPAIAPPADLLARRRAGVLAHISSLPGGDLSHDAYRFVEFAAASGFTVWQVLPIGPTDETGSPYLSRSTHAGNPLIISLDWLVDRGWLAAKPSIGSGAAGRYQALRDAYEGYRREANSHWRARFEEIRSAQACWLDDYALFVALDAEYGAPWTTWPQGLRDRAPAALAAARGLCAQAIARVEFEQIVFRLQWAELRAYGHKLHVHLFGDLPIFVGHHSADVWSHRSCFQLDAEGGMSKVAGVPPDYFSEEGQRWGNPLYDWAAMERDGFAWWVERLRTQLTLFDLVRVDHFRGLEACWEIPASALTAKDGEWVTTPGAGLLSALKHAHGRLPLVAEDLGLITPEVDALRVRFAIPGMRVLQFGFDGSPHNINLPQNFEPLTVCYTGTHDNAPAREWFEALDPHTRLAVQQHFAREQLPTPWPVIHAALGSVARLAIIPMQDLLGLGAGHRMNTPGTATGNWAWRFEWSQVPADLARSLRDINWRCGR
ncbi:MAG: 4-alpha-glucanotransferase [Panacagrimonas sp.]